jgi:integrase
MAAMRALLEANGDDPALFGLHSTRHGGTAAMLAAGASDHEVAAAAGWRSTKMVSVYCATPTLRRATEVQRAMERKALKSAHAEPAGAMPENALARPRGPEGPGGGGAAHRRGRRA